MYKKRKAVYFLFRLFHGKAKGGTKGKDRKLGSRSLDCPSTTENDLSAIQKSGGLFVPFLRAAVSHFVSLT